MSEDTSDDTLLVLLFVIGAAVAGFALCLLVSASNPNVVTVSGGNGTALVTSYKGKSYRLVELAPSVELHTSRGVVTEERR